MIIAPREKVIIKCKKCRKNIKEEYGFPPYIPDVIGVVWFFMILKQILKQKYYNKKFKTKNINYSFVICEECKKNEEKGCIK